VRGGEDGDGRGAAWVVPAGGPHPGFGITPVDDPALIGDTDVLHYALTLEIVRARAR